MNFNLPDPPDHLIFPEPAQSIANWTLGAVVAVLVVYALREWLAGRGPLAILLVIGGGISLLHEPVLDVLGPLWHPRPGQDTVLETFGPVPLWGLWAYALFFGGGTYLAYRQLQRPTTRRRFWATMAGLWAVNLVIELPLLASGMYQYYGYDEPPMMVGGLPLYWLIINSGAPFCAACLLHAAPSAFRGWLVLRALLVPLCVYSAYSMAVAWPVFAAAHTRGAPEAVEWGAALLTIALGVTIMHELAGWVARRDLTPEAAPRPAGLRRR